MIFVNGAFGRQLGLDEVMRMKPWPYEISALIKSDTKELSVSLFCLCLSVSISLSPSPTTVSLFLSALRKGQVRTQQEVSHLHAKKGVFTRDQPYRHTDLKFQLSELWEKKFPLFKPPNLWYFVWQPELIQYTIQYSLHYNSTENKAFHKIITFKPL